MVVLPDQLAGFGQYPSSLCPRHRRPGGKRFLRGLDSEVNGGLGRILDGAYLSTSGRGKVVVGGTRLLVVRTVCDDVHISSE